MLVILARQQDQTARWLAERWKQHDAQVLTSADLSTPGWCYQIPENGGCQAVVSGRVVATEEIAGVLTRLPCVDEFELKHIIPEDRSYVSSEMTSFLAAWLSGLACRVLNRPSPACLTGPNWRTERWVQVAAQLGIPVCPVRRGSTVTREALNAARRTALFMVTVVGDRWFGEVDETAGAQALRLAQAAGADLLTAHFEAMESGYALRCVDLQPDASSREVADAILEYLTADPR